ncbi:DNA gyrase inhibitor YacG [Ferrovibrio xuzhouensis]|uniref:DNA gyrase inhibitor YacG n=1 Tax=Ferrovibrio xuzhouensis TaxID=1576914 RepID=A0ABV7VDR6_9PROT
MTHRTCPICGKPAVVNHLPFCSARCADVDLNRWLKGTYAIPAVEVDDENSGEDVPEDEGDLSARMH